MSAATPSLGIGGGEREKRPSSGDREVEDTRVESFCHCQETETSKGTDAMERTYVMIKPDGVQRGLVGKIIQRFEEKGYFLKALKMKMVEKSLAEEHYADLSSKPFFSGLVDYICSGPVVCMVWEGKEVVKTGRLIIGATNPLASTPGTIRGDFCIDVGRNVIHGSDAVESAQKEIALWFPEGVAEYEHACRAWIYE